MTREASPPAPRLALLALLALTGCRTAALEGPAPAEAAAPRTAPVALRLLYTSDEHGWIAPAADKGRARGGAPELLARWKTLERHCVPAPGRPCEQSETLALSGGDNWTGPALSSFYGGEPAAALLKLLGYEASALGNHELDFGRPLFEKNAAIEGFPYLGANVLPAADAGGLTRPFVLVRRRGITLAVIGLSTHTTAREGMRDNYKGLSFGDEETALADAIPRAYDAGADAVVVVAHACASYLKPILKRHPDWRLAFVGAGHCHRVESERVFLTPMVEPGSYLQTYARVSLVIDPARPARERVESSEVTLVDLTYPEGDAPPLAPDPEARALVAAWQQRATEALGEVIGYAGETLEPDAPPLVNLITDSWRAATGADVAILNRFGTRQAIPKGPISLETIYSVMPFLNHLVTLHVSGEELARDVTCCKAHVSGVHLDPRGMLVLEGGRPIDPRARYALVATDYTYLGGSGFTLEKQDPEGVFGEDWRAPLVRFLRAHPTSPARGLETLVDPRSRLRPER